MIISIRIPIQSTSPSSSCRRFSPLYVTNRTTRLFTLKTLHRKEEITVAKNDYRFVGSRAVADDELISFTKGADKVYGSVVNDAHRPDGTIGVVSLVSVMKASDVELDKKGNFNLTGATKNVLVTYLEKING